MSLSKLIEYSVVTTLLVLLLTPDVFTQHQASTTTYASQDSRNIVIYSDPLHSEEHSSNLACNPPNAPTRSRCGTGDIILTATKSDASALVVGEEFRWYDAAVGGTLLENNSGSFARINLATTTDYYVSFFDGTCESSRVKTTATVIQLLKPVVTDAARCGPGTITLTASGATAGQKYQWYQFASSSTFLKESTDHNDNTYTTVNLSSNRSFFVAIANSDGSCTSDRVRVTAIINSSGTVPGTPTAMATPAASCTAGTFTLNASGAIGGQLYKWYDSDQATVLKTSTNHIDNTFDTPTVASTKNFYVSVVDPSCGSTESPLVRVEVLVGTAVPPTVTPASRCGSGTVTLGASGGVDGEYRWYESLTSSIALETNSTFTTPALATNMTYYVSLAKGSCESSRVAVTATVNANSNPTISGTNQACVGTTVTYNAGSTGNTYVWNITGGTITAGAGTPSITVQWGTGTTGSLTLNETVGGLCSKQLMRNFTIKPVPAPAITGATSGCVAEQTTYSTADVLGSTYTWTVNGGSITSGQGTHTITVSWGTGARSISVEEDNGACKTTTSVNVKPNPVISGSTSACQNIAGIMYSTAGNSGHTYSWAITGGTINSGANTNQVSVTWTNATSGSLTVTETSPLTCATTTSAFTVSIFTKPAVPAVTGDMNICAFTLGTSYEATYTITSPNANYVYSWSIVNPGDGQIASTTNADSTQIKIRWSNNLPFNSADLATTKFRVLARVKGTDCGGNAHEQNITVRRSPLKPQLLDNVDSVYVNTIRTYGITTNNVGSNYAWTVEGGTIQSGLGTNQITVKWSSTTGTRRVFVKETVTSTSCENFSDTATVYVLPYVVVANAVFPTICEGGQVKLKGLDINKHANKFAWYTAVTGGTKLGESTNNDSASDTLSITQNAQGSYTYYVTPVTASGVNGADDSGGDNARMAVNFNVVNNAPSNFMITGDATSAQSCASTGSGGGAITLTNVSGGFAGSPYTFLWTKTDDASFRASTRNIVNLAPGNYSVRVTDAGGCTSDVVSFEVKDQRQLVTDGKITPTGADNLLTNTVGDTATITLGQTIQLTAMATNVTTYAWSANTDANVANISDISISSPDVTPTQTTRYSVLLTNDKGCDTTISIVVRILSTQMFVPTVFTPNNDNKNDRFQIFARQVETLTIRVYNRNGKIVYESSNKEEFLGSNDFGIKTNATQNKGWDGTYQQAPLPKGNYVWYLTGKFKNGTEIKKSGNILLVR